MKDAEDEAFDEIARKQGGGFMAKRAMAADKLREPVCDKDPQDCWNVRCQLGKQCKNLAQPSKPNSRRRTMEREALNLAIIALGCIEYGPFGINDGPSEDTTELAITAIKEALAQPAQEPHEYDWSMLEAAKESLREHMARIKELEAALKQALEALEHISKFGCNHVRGVCTCEYREAADAIKAALAQPAQEPVQRPWVGLTEKDRIKYGTSWEKDGERIDPMSVYKEQPEQEPVAWSYWQSCLNDDGTQTAPWVHRLSKFKPTESIINKDVTPLYTTPPQREWVGLTDEEIDEGNKQSWVTKQAWESAVWWASEKLKERNHGT